MLLSDDEFDQIRAFAENCRMPMSGYLRLVGLGRNPAVVKPQLESCQAIMGFRGDLNRVGGLLKMWLTDRHNYSSTQHGTINHILEQIEKINVDVSSAIATLCESV